MPVILATDLLVWILIAFLIAYAIFAKRRAHIAGAWRRVFRSRAAMASIVVLLGFMLVGLLDSLHFRPQLPAKAGEPKAFATEVLSVLDTGLSQFRGRGEKTYSAPLATHAYAKEQIELPDGRQMRDFPRLRFGGAHLASDSEWAADVTRRLLAGFGIAMLLVLALTPVLKFLRRVAPDIPWGASGASLAVLLLLAGLAFALSTGYHVLGTDKVGQDVFHLALKSIRTSLVIGTLTTLVLLPVGIGLGMAAGYFRGWIDDAIQYLYTTLNAIPGILLIAASALMVQVYIDTHPDTFATAVERADFKLLMLCAILGLTSWTGLARLLRGESLKVSQLEYVQAAQAFGVRSSRILMRHLLPNVSHLVIITIALDFSAFVLAEAVLSYIGVGVDPSANSFGTMINAARLEMSRDPIVWWTISTAFVFMVALVLAANLFADAVRDGFDPRVRV